MKGQTVGKKKQKEATVGKKNPYLERSKIQIYKR